VESETADVKMKCLAPKLKSKRHALQEKSCQVVLPKSKVTKLRNREEETGSKFLRSGTPMQKKKGKLKSVKNYQVQVLLPKINVVKLKDREELGTSSLRSGTPISRKLRAPLERPKERQQQVEMRHRTTVNLPPLDDLIPTVVASAGKDGMCSGKVLLHYIDEQHPGYGIGAGKQWKLRAAVNYALAAGKVIQVRGRGLAGTFSLPRPRAGRRRMVQN